MNTSFSQHLRHTADGTIWGFLAEALILPTGLITASYLTHQLGPEGYGLFTLVSTLIGWITLSTTALFSRTTIKFVSEADDWRPIGTTVLRLHLIFGFGVMLLLWLTAKPIAALLGEPKLAIYLQVFAFEPLLFSLSRAHQNIVIGLGRFRQQALPSAVRWIARLLLIVFFVEMGLSVSGAILGSIGATLVELVIYRFYARPSLFSQSMFPATELWSYATPLFLSAISMQLFNRIDLFALMALRGTAQEAGIYGAAQNLSIVPGLLGISLSPLLLSTMGRMLKTGQDQDARMMGCDAMRLILGMLPFAGMASGAAHEIVVLIFGNAFAATAPLLALLIFGKVSAVMLSVTGVVMVAADRPRLTFALAGPMLLLALAGHAILIPHLGAIGAALVTTTITILGTLAALAIVYRLWNILPPLGTLGRSVLLGGLAYMVAAIWPTPGFWVILKLLVIVIMIPIGFWLLGEFNGKEIAAIRSVLQRRIPLRQN